MVEYKEMKLIDDADLRPLYESVGWVSYTNQVSDLSRLLAASQLVYAAWDASKLVGLIRTVGDGISIQYVQDLLVMPAYQKQGIGSELLKRVMEASKDIRQLVLITDGEDENKAAIAFYKKHGLQTFEETKICGLWRSGALG